MDTKYKSHSFVKLWIATTIFILCCFTTDMSAQNAAAADTVAAVTETITEVVTAPAEEASAAPDTVGELALGLNTVWMLLAAMLVFFMQPGFALVEAGFTRVKNTANILMKNFVDFMFGSLLYWFIGFGLMFGAGGFIGMPHFFDLSFIDNGLPTEGFLIFQTVFCATAATIVSGAMAERTKFLAYLLYSAAISIFIYPVTGHWIWGGGWLAQMGFHDFAGSTAVHMVGGICALVGAKILGPRIGKYDKEGNARAIPGHNLSIAALGVFILWFCWFGFNCGSTTAASTNLGDIAMTTNLAAAAATLATLVVTWIRYGKPDVSMTFNGSLAGLVAITAGCDTVSNYSAIIIGLIAGILVVFSVEFFDKVAKIDDPVGAISVHGVCGFTGSILVGVFSPEYTLKTQVIGVLSTVAYVLVMAIIVFTIIDKTVGLRVTKGEELDGLDIHEHGCSAYADFNFRL